jgi:hypothetical protein
MSPKETRYRRLLALYPDDFRREYADEMRWWWPRWPVPAGWA